MTDESIEDDRGVWASYNPYKAQAAHVAASHEIDRRYWTQGQWVDDAERLMDDLDGSVRSLTNGHVMAMLAEIRHLRTVLAITSSERDLAVAGLTAYRLAFRPEST